MNQSALDEMIRSYQVTRKPYNLEDISSFPHDGGWCIVKEVTLNFHKIPHLELPEWYDREIPRLCAVGVPLDDHIVTTEYNKYLASVVHGRCSVNPTAHPCLKWGVAIHHPEYNLSLGSVGVNCAIRLTGDAKSVKELIGAQRKVFRRIQEKNQELIEEYHRWLEKSGQGSFADFTSWRSEQNRLRALDEARRLDRERTRQEQRALRIMAFPEEKARKEDLEKSRKQREVEAFNRRREEEEKEAKRREAERQEYLNAQYEKAREEQLQRERDESIKMAIGRQARQEQLRQEQEIQQKLDTIEIQILKDIHEKFGGYPVSLPISQSTRREVERLISRILLVERDVLSGSLVEFERDATKQALLSLIYDAIAAEVGYEGIKPRPGNAPIFVSKEQWQAYQQSIKQSTQQLELFEV